VATSLTPSSHSSVSSLERLSPDRILFNLSYFLCQGQREKRRGQRPERERLTLDGGGRESLISSTTSMISWNLRFRILFFSSSCAFAANDFCRLCCSDLQTSSVIATPATVKIKTSLKKLAPFDRASSSGNGLTPTNLYLQY
jgi:hypothetical protein